MIQALFFHFFVFGAFHIALNPEASEKQEKDAEKEYARSAQAEPGGVVEGRLLV